MTCSTKKKKKEFELLNLILAPCFQLDPFSLTIRATKEYQHVRIQAELSSDAHDFGCGRVCPD